MLFNDAIIKYLFGLSNEKFIFEGVHHSFRLCLLGFEKGGSTQAFEAAFRINPREAIAAGKLESFLAEVPAHLTIPIELVKKLSPASLSLMEFRSEIDIRVAEKMSGFPSLGARCSEKWNLRLSREFDMTNDSDLFRLTLASGRLPVYEGKMIHQFDHRWKGPKYWIEEKEGRRRLLGKTADTGQALPYESYRLAFRDIARSTDERTMIASILPCRVFAGNTLNLSDTVKDKEMLAILALLNSFVVDSAIRQKVSAHCNMFYVYQLPIPRVTEADEAFTPIVSRAARLVCMTEEFAELWEEVMGTLWSHDVAAANLAERSLLRAELDGLVAHLYGLTEEEFAHILSTFPVVPQAVKVGALEAYRQFAPRPGDPEIGRLIAQGESHELEFKSTVRWDLREQRKNPELERVVQKTVAGFLNAEGGVLLLGVADDGSVVGLEPDLRTLKKANRDGYELFLMDLLLNALGRDFASCIRVTFHPYDGKEVCRVTLSRGHQPAYLKEEKEEVLYIRAGNSTRRLTIRETVDYVRTRWG